MEGSTGFHIGSSAKRLKGKLNAGYKNGKRERKKSAAAKIIRLGRTLS